jgi:hypothetical protein
MISITHHKNREYGSNISKHLHKERFPPFSSMRYDRAVEM